MEFVVDPLDQVFPAAALDVNVTLPPWQKVNGPDALMEGVETAGKTVTTTGEDVAEHPEDETVTVYVPEALTVMDCDVELLDHRLPEVALEVSRTLPPWQKESGPFAVTLGVAGTGLTVTVLPVEVAEQYPLVTVTE